MVWARIDDSILDNAKILRAGPLGIAMHLAGVTWCCRNLTDGFVPFGRSELLLDWRGVLEESEDQKMAPEYGEIGHRVSGCHIIRSKLEANRLWDRDEERGGWVIHDFLVYNPSRSQVLRERQDLHAVRSLAGKIGGKCSGVSRLKQARSKHPSKPEPKAKQIRSPEPVPVPDPQKESLFQRDQKGQEQPSGARLQPLSPTLTQRLLEVFENRRMDTGGTILNDLDPDALYRQYYDSRLGSGRPVASVEHDWSSYLRIYTQNKLASRRANGPRGAQDAPGPHYAPARDYEPPEGGICPPPPDLVAALGNIGSGGR